MTAWSQAYHTAKAPRTLKWRPHLGLVELDLEVDDVKVACRVSPLLATMLQLFEGKEAWRASEMAKQVWIQGFLWDLILDLLAPF